MFALLPSMRSLFRCFLLPALLGLAACAPPPAPPVLPPPPATFAPPPVVPALPPPPLKVPVLEAVPWEMVEGWPGDDPGAALIAFRQSCRAIGRKPVWEQVCAEAGRIDPIDEAAVRAFFTDCFIPYRTSRPDGKESGLITGYYVPDLAGSRTPSERFAWPLYGVPDDLLIIDLRSVYPDLANYRLRGRLVGRRVVPYWDRAEIDGEQAPLKGRELFWVEDPVELFFLHIQGSGRVTLENGERVMAHYADQNGYPFRSIGKLLIERGEMTRDQMSMQAIRAWARSHPEETRSLLAENPSYVFFSELAADDRPPPGALGVRLTAERSLAVDPRTIPLGAPVFLATTRPSSTVPLQRLMVAQDTGGAIKGEVRADFFWGMGDAAGELAGRMKQQGRLWVLYPVGAVPPGVEEP
jgi:membrane-bound lytic murein transglycosylase A